MLKNLLIVLAILIADAIAAQNAPVTTLGSVESAVPGAIQVPVNVINFSNIGAIYLSVDYDYSVVQLTGATPHPQLPTFLYGDSDLGTGFHRILMGWYGNGLSLPDGSTIMMLNFNYSVGNTELTFYENGPSCEYANADGNVLNDLPTSDYYINGQVCGLLGNPGSVAGDNAVCQGHGDVVYTIDPMPNATAYTWSVPVGAAIVCGQNTCLVLVSFADDAVSGSVQVYAVNPCGNSASSQLSVTVNPKPVADAGSDGFIPYGTSTMLQAASGGSGSFSYHWSPEELLVNPDVQDPVTVILESSTIFSLLVTNLSTQCQASDQVIISISGGPLNVNPMAVPASTCAGGAVQLNALASGGTENYTYLWTSDPPGWSSVQANPVVWPDSTTVYQLEIYDEFNLVNGAVNIPVFDLPTATISGDDTLCGNGAMAEITVELTGLPPWDFIYTYRSISHYVSGQYSSPYIFSTGEAGSYSISFLKNSGCTGLSYGSALISLFPVPPAPVISLIETTLVSNACCGNQWYHNEIAIPGATGISYTATESGRYTDIVTRFSCVSDTSNVINVIIDGIPENGSLRFDIFPNPATDLIHGRLNMDDGRLNMGFILEVFDVYGRIVKESFMPEGSGGFELEAASLSPGLYIVVIRSETEMFAMKVVLK